jgi:response regulator of citrate/malate metabolism
LKQILALVNYNQRNFDLRFVFDKILECLLSEKNYGHFMTSEEISAETNFSKMTVRRYLNYLIEQKKAVSRINYSTGGRPSIEYSILK